MSFTLNILKDDHPTLQERSEPYTVEEILQPETQDFVDKLWTTMTEAGGAGISAPQVGVLKRLIIVDVPGCREAMFNPRIVSQRQFKTLVEGCLSFPDHFRKIRRKKYVSVKYFDRKGRERFVINQDLAAQVIQHEIDHLNGVVFTTLGTQVE